MKLFYLILFLSLSLFSKSQNSSDTLPLKNGLVYYTFEHKLNNENKCLSSHFDNMLSGALLGKLLPKLTELNLNKAKVFSKYNSYLSFTPGSLYAPVNCQDTTIAGMLSFSVESKKETITITAKVQVIFINKTTYILKISSFIHNSGSIKGLKYNYKEQPLGEVYQEYIKTGMKSKNEKKLFSTVNFYAHEIDRIVEEIIIELYQADE